MLKRFDICLTTGFGFSFQPIFLREDAEKSSELKGVISSDAVSEHLADGAEEVREHVHGFKDAYVHRVESYAGSHTFDANIVKDSRHSVESAISKMKDCLRIWLMQVHQAGPNRCSLTDFAVVCELI